MYIFPKMFSSYPCFHGALLVLAGLQVERLCKSRHRSDRTDKSTHRHIHINTDKDKDTETKTHTQTQIHSDKDTRTHRHTYTLRSLELVCNVGSKYQHRALSLWHHLTNIEGNSGGCLLLCPFPPRSCSTPPWPGWTSCWQELFITILVFVILISLFILIFF